MHFFISMAVAILKQFIPLYSLTRMGHFSISLLLVHMTSSKFKTKYELSIPLSFYFHKVLELLNTNIYTKFLADRALSFVIEHGLNF